MQSYIAPSQIGEMYEKKKTDQIHDRLRRPVVMNLFFLFFYTSMTKENVRQTTQDKDHRLSNENFANAMYAS